jgi:hypothetical protein
MQGPLRNRHIIVAVKNTVINTINLLLPTHEEH